MANGLTVTDQLRVLDRELRSIRQVKERDEDVLREKARKEYVQQESDWQKNVNVWLGRANRKLEAREREDSKDNDRNAKRARLEKRKMKKRGLEKTD